MAEKAKPSVFVRDATGLVRQLSTRDILMFNLLNMGLIWPMLYIYFAGSTYQGVYIPLTVLAALPLTLVIALMYYFLSSAFPRTGGDYVWVGRIIHPAVGFTANFAFNAFFIGALGFVAPWVTVYGLNTLFVNLGTVTGNAGYFTLASEMTTTNAQLAGDLILLASLVLATFVGLKWTFRYQWFCFIFVLVGAVVFAAAFLTSSPSTFQSHFNATSATSYNGIISAAKNAGYLTGFTLMGTLFGSFYSFLNYLGYSFSTYLGGEVRQSQKAQYYAVIIGTLIFAAVTFLMFEIPWAVIGGSFLNSASLLAAGGNPAWSLPSAPITSYLVVFASSNPIVAVLIPIAIIMAVFGASETIIVAAVRMVFAWSFDGVIPTMFSNVSEKRGSPNNAIALVTGIAVVYVLISVYVTNILTILTYSTSGIYLAIAVTGLAAILLPYRRKQLFAQAQGPIQRRIGGVPVITLLGLGTFLTGIFVAVVAADPAIAGSPGAPVNPLYIGFLAFTFLIGLLIYVASYFIQKSRGVDITLRFKEIPPE